MFQFHIDHDIDTFLERKGDQWDALARGVPFRETSWLGPWWRIYGGDKRAEIVVATDESGTLRGLLPLYRHWGDRTLRMMGDGDACSDHVSVLADDGDAIQIAEAMGVYLSAIACEKDCGWDTLDIDGVVEGDEPMAALARGLKSAGAALHTRSRMSTWFKPADASWDEHLKNHGKTQRRRMRRMREKISEEGCMDRLVAENEAQVDEFLASIIELHQKRWNSVGEKGSFADPKFVEFSFAVSRELLRRGELYLNVIQHEGRTLAGELNIVGKNRIMYSYSAGYDIDAGDMEPGRLVAIDTLLQLYRDNLAGIDFMRGDETYKKRLSTSSRRLLRMRATAPKFLPRLRHAAWCTQFELKQWMRRRTGRTPVSVLDITTPAQSPINTAQ